VRLDRALPGQEIAPEDEPPHPGTGILGGSFLRQRNEIPHPEFPDSILIIAADPGGETYTQHYFDSRGVARIYKMTFGEGKWTLLRDAQDFTPRHGSCSRTHRSQALPPFAVTRHRRPGERRESTPAPLAPQSKQCRQSLTADPPGVQRPP
jgi:hypothetical protein